MPEGSQRSETQIRNTHQYERQKHRVLQPLPLVENAADEDADQKRPKTEGDVVHGNLVVGIAHVVEQQPEREIGQRVTHLVYEDESQHEPGARTAQELLERAGDRLPQLGDALARHGHGPASGLAQPQRREHRRQREQGTSHVRHRPAGARRHHERQRACGGGADAPAVLGHSRTHTQLMRLQRFDAVGIDDDVVGGPGDADQYRRDDRRLQTRLRIDEREIDDRGDDEQTRQPQPRHSLAEASDHGQTYAVDHPRPEHREVVDEESQREGSDRLLVDAVLCEARGERGADHGVRESRRHADEECTQCLTSQIRANGGEHAHRSAALIASSRW